MGVWNPVKRRFDPLGLLALAVTLLGLFVLGHGVLRVSQIGYTDYEELRYGQAAIFLSMWILLGASLLLLLRRRWVLAAFVAAPGTACALLAYGLPEALLAGVAFLALVFPASGAAITGSFSRPPRRPAEGSNR